MSLTSSIFNKAPIFRILMIHLLLGFFPLQAYGYQSLTIMIDPFGDATHIGRHIDDSFERSITLQWAQALKQAIEQISFSIVVIITRSATDTVFPLQNANYANRLGIDLYMSLSSYHAPDIMTLQIYRYACGNDTPIDPSTLALIPYNHAHRLRINSSAALSNQLAQLCTKEPTKIGCGIQGPYALPFKPLIGITAASIGLELGLNNKQDWRFCVEPLARALVAACTTVLEAS